MNIIKNILAALLIALVVIQFLPSTKNIANQPVTAVFEKETNTSKEVIEILNNKCYDCHSNHTKYPWYGEIAPISFWINGHIEEGKEHFNVSDWAAFDLEKKKHKMEELVEEVEENKMPEDYYTWMHGNLSSQEKEKIIQWGKKALKDM